MAGLRLSAVDVLFNSISITALQAVDLGLSYDGQIPGLILRNTQIKWELGAAPELPAQKHCRLSANVTMVLH